MPAFGAAGEEEGPEEHWRRRNTIPTISNTSTAMHATRMPIISPVAKDWPRELPLDLEELVAGAADGVDDGVDDGADDGAGDENVAKTVENLSILMDPSPVMGSHPVVG